MLFRSNQINVVNDTIKDLGVEKPILYVFNKIDKLSSEDIEQLQKEIIDYQPHVLIHTQSKDGVKQLVNYLMNYKF